MRKLRVHGNLFGELHTVVQRCNLETVDNMLCDRLVFGINDGSIQKRLLAE